MRVRPALVTAAVVPAMALLVGCGARTDLDTDFDASPPDAAPPDVRRPVDAGPGDAGPDARPRFDAAVPSGLTGTWVTIAPDGRRGSVQQLHERADGRVLVTILGGTTGQLVESARVRGATFEITTYQRNPRRESEMTEEGTVDGEEIRFLRMRDGVPVTILWRRVPGPFVEQRWLLEGVDFFFQVELDVVLEDGELVSGSVVSREECSPFPCQGEVTAFRERVDRGTRTLRIEGSSTGQVFELDLMGGAPPGSLRTGSGRIAFDDGRVDVFDLTATLVAVTRSDDAGQLLGALGAIADAREDGTLGIGLPISPEYLHDGTDHSGLLTALRAEAEPVSALTVDISRLREMRTRGADGVPTFVPPVGLHFRERVTGTDDSGLTLTLRDADTTERGADRLRLFAWTEAAEGAKLLVAGNQTR